MVHYVDFFESTKLNSLNRECLSCLPPRFPSSGSSPWPHIHMGKRKSIHLKGKRQVAHSYPEGVAPFLAIRGSQVEEEEQ